MRELPLYTGAGGGLQGSLLLGWKPVGYVEFNDYCQRVIAQRIKDGILPNAPIFSDIRSFISEGYANAYQGMVDVITAGWPCQPHSQSGRRKGTQDEREGWPYTIETIRQVKPRWFLGENVRGILSTDSGRYFGTILRDLADAGYQCRWGVFSACAVGAPHPRERLFILAYADGPGSVGRRECRPSTPSAQRREERKWGKYSSEDTRPFCSSLWDTDEADVLRVPDGLGSKLERLRAIGNGQVPVVVAAAWHQLTRGLDLECTDSQRTPKRE